MEVRIKDMFSSKRRRNNQDDQQGRISSLSTNGASSMPRSNLPKTTFQVRDQPNDPNKNGQEPMTLSNNRNPQSNLGEHHMDGGVDPNRDSRYLNAGGKPFSADSILELNLKGGESIVTSEEITQPENETRCKKSSDRDKPFHTDTRSITTGAGDGQDLDGSGISVDSIDGQYHDAKTQEEIENSSKVKSQSTVQGEDLNNKSTAGEIPLGSQPSENRNLIMEPSYQDLQKKSKELEKEIGTLRDEKAVLEGEKASLASLYHEEKENYIQRVETLEFELIQAKSQVQKFEDLNIASLETIQTLQETSTRYRTERNNERQTLKRAQQDIHELRLGGQKTAAELTKYQLEASSHAEDSFFFKRWADLDQLIVSWSWTYFNGKPRVLEKRKESGQNDQHHFRRVAENPQDYLKDSNRRPYFVQSFVWSVLVDRVFDYPGRIGRSMLTGLCWSNAHRDNIDALADYLYPDSRSNSKREDNDIATRKYMKWRAATAQLVLEKINKDPNIEISISRTILKELVEYVMRNLQPYQTPSDESSQDSVQKSCQDSIENILRQAIHLDAKINRVWAQIVPHYSWNGSSTRFLHGFDFDPSLMARAEGGKKGKDYAKVKLILCPALVRLGTMDGEQYHKPELIRHAQVHL